MASPQHGKTRAQVIYGIQLPKMQDFKFSILTNFTEWISYLINSSIKSVQ